MAKARMVTDERDGEIAMENIRGNGEAMHQLKGFFITIALLLRCSAGTLVNTPKRI